MQEVVDLRGINKCERWKLTFRELVGNWPASAASGQSKPWIRTPRPLAEAMETPFDI